MDIIRFDLTEDLTKLENAEVVNGIRSKLWIERHDKAGEFSFIGPIDSGLKEKLPIGSIVSHINTPTIMIVENHEISDVKGNITEIEVSGRGFETIFENRIVGSNKALPSNTGIADFVLSKNFTWVQIVELISKHILASELVDATNAIPYVEVLHNVEGLGVSEERTIPRTDLYSEVQKLINVDNLGIRVFRPGPLNPLGEESSNIAVLIHAGKDLSESVVFSYETGEIERADYFWSNRKTKNAALVSGKWVETLVSGEETQEDRRTMFVNADDIDGEFSVAPTGATLTNIVNLMEQRGLEALSNQNKVEIVKAEVSQDVNHSGYRKVFNVGDLITVSGKYNSSSKMKVTEYVEIDDEKGFKGYPTLSIGTILPEVSFRSYIMSHNPEVYFPFDETEGNAVEDVSGNDYHGWFEGTPPPVLDTPGVIGSGIYFQKTDAQRMRFPTQGIFGGDEPFTITMFVKAVSWGQPTNPNSVSNASVIFSGYGENLIVITQADSVGMVNTWGVRVQINGSWQSPVNVGSLSLNVWYHITFTYHPLTGFKSYLNGAPVGTSAFVGTFTSSAGAENFIGGHTSTSRTSQAYVDEVAIFNKVLTPEEIDVLYSLSL